MSTKNDDALEHLLLYLEMCRQGIISKAGRAFASALAKINAVHREMKSLKHGIKNKQKQPSITLLPYLLKIIFIS